MCGRFTLTKPPDIIARHFSLDEDAALAARAQPRYNIAPTQNIYAVRWSGGKPELAEHRWGLLPSGASWRPDPAAAFKTAPLLINARAETLAEKPAFRDCLRSRRCLVPADGFYEWKGKQPWHIALDKDGDDASLFAFAGLWDAWRAPGGAVIASCTIITTAPNERLAAIHNRMPAILPPVAYPAWLHGDEREALSLLRPFPAGAFRIHPVSALVSRPGNDVPACREPLGRELLSEDALGNAPPLFEF